MFVVTFIKLIKKNNMNYIYGLVLEFICIFIEFIYIIMSKTPNLSIYIILFVVSIIIPSIFFVLDNKNITIKEIYYLSLAKLNKGENNNKILDILEKYPNSSYIHKKNAEYYEKNNEYEKAINEYYKAIKLKTSDYDSYYKLANILHITKNDDDAIEILESLLKNKPNNINASMLLGNILYENEHYKEAITIYNRAIKYSPGKYEIYYNLGMTYTRLNDFENAKECYQKAATLNSIKDISNLNLGQISLIFKDYDEAEKYFFNGIKSDDNKIVANSYYYLAKIKLIQKNNEQAIQYCNIAIEIYPNIRKKIEDDNYFTVILGKISLKNLEEKAINTKIKKEQEDIINYLGQTYEVVENLTEAPNFHYKMNDEKTKYIDK